MEHEDTKEGHNTLMQIPNLCFKISVLTSKVLSVKSLLLFNFESFEIELLNNFDICIIVQGISSYKILA